MFPACLYARTGFAFRQLVAPSQALNVALLLFSAQRV